MCNNVAKVLANELTSKSQIRIDRASLSGSEQLYK